MFDSVKKYEFNPGKRKALKMRYKLLLSRYGEEPRSRNIHDYYYDFPIRDKTILISGLGRNVRGSMQYVLNVLNSDPDFEGYKIYVRTDPNLTEEAVSDFIKENNWTRTSTVSSLKEFEKKMESCKYLITESYFPYDWIKKPGQIMIDLWHGTPLKNLGVLKNGDRCHKTAIQQKNFLCADYLMYPNDFTRDVMWNSYKITSLLQAKALFMGYPRTSGILKVTAAEAESIRKILAPSGEHIYAYMPTFRGYLSDDAAIEKETDFLDYIDERLRDDQILYVNLHHHIKEGLDCSKYKHIKLFPPLVDSYKLLSVCESLISDYSSVFFDYLVLQRQIILYIEDLDTYLSYQGMNMPIEQLPFDLARNKDQVIEMLNRGKDYDDSEIFKEMCSNDSADNPEKFCRLLRGSEEGLNIEEIPNNDKVKVLLYAEGLAEGSDTKRLFDIAENCNQEEYEMYIECDEKKVGKDKRGAYPHLHNNLLISSKDLVKYSSIGSPLLKLYKEKKISFDKAFKFLQYEYALISRRRYGDTQFDIACIYDVVKPETILGVALSETKRKLLFISDRMAKKIAKENAFLIDAVRLTAQYCEAIIVDSPEKKSLIEGILHSFDKKKILTLKSAEDIIAYIETSSRG